MKKTIAILVLTLFLTGCFNYRDINRVIFVTALCIDIDDDDKYIVIAEAFASTRGTGETAGQEVKALFTGSGDTMFEALRAMTTTSPLKLNYTQNKAIIFSTKAAKHGLNDFIDLLFRDQEFLVRQHVYISAIDLKDLVNLKLTEEMFLGIFLNDLAENMPARTKRPQMRIDEYYVSRKLGNKIVGLNLIDKVEDSIVDRIVINQLAIMNEDKLIDTLDYHEAFFYNIMTDNLNLGHIKIPNPDVEGSFITLEILNLKTKTHTNYDGGNTVDITKEINIRTTIASVQDDFHIYNYDRKNKLDEIAADVIKKGVTDLYEQFKEKDIDIYNLKRYVDIKYPNANVDDDNMLNSINLIIKPNIFIEGSTDVVDFY